jgi:hypothetical protein
MKNVNQNNYIDEGCLPVRANLKVLRRSDPDYGLTEDEIMDRKGKGYKYVRLTIANAIKP